MAVITASPIVTPLSSSLQSSGAQPVSTPSPDALSTTSAPPATTSAATPGTTGTTDQVKAPPPPVVDTKPAFNTTISISPKTLRTIAKVTDVETGEVILSIPPQVVSTSYSATAAAEEAGLVTSSYS